MPTMITRGAASAKGFGFTNATKLGPLPDASFNISQFTYKNYLELSPSFKTIALPSNNPYLFTVSEDGQYFYINDYASNTVYQFILIVPYDITTATTSGYVSGDISAGQNNAHMGMTWKPDGTSFIVGNYSVGPFVKYNVSTPWMVNTITSSTVGTAPSGMTGGYTRVVSNDGLRTVVQPANGDVAYQYNFGTAWDVTTIGSSPSRTTTINGTATDRFQTSFTNEGQWFLTIDGGVTPRRLYQYASTTPYNIQNGGNVAQFSYLSLNEPSTIVPTPRLTNFVLVGGQRYLYIMQQRGDNDPLRQIFCYAKLT